MLLCTACNTNLDPVVYKLNIFVTDTLGGKVNGNGTYAEGSKVIIKTFANTGWELNKWSDIEGLETEREIILVSDSTITVTFVAKPSVIINGHEAVDMGLSVCWAAYNVGAKQPQEAGNYYAWAEISTKSTYSWAMYVYCNGDPQTCSDLGSISGTQFDVAHMKWGETWRMPTQREQEELYDNCIWEWSKLQDIKGYIVKSKKNGNTIFLPLTGYYSGKNLVSAGDAGFYWSGTFNETEKEKAGNMVLSGQFEQLNNVFVSYTYRLFGLPIRAVCK